ncbi:MAG: DUF4446 family protein [Minisyncoccia bacterium]
MDQQTLIVILSTFVGVLFVGFVWLALTLRKLTRGSNGASLEKHITRILAYHEEYTAEHGKVIHRLNSLEDRMRRAVRKISTVRFDPFEGQGSGKQSFAIALIDDEGNGAILSSLHSHSQTKVFAKPIEGFNSLHELSDEEIRAIAQAK